MPNPSNSPPPPTRLTDEQVRHVAKLSRLSLTDEQIHRFAGQISDILVHVSKLNELDVDGIEPMAHALDITNVLREDQPTPGLPIDAVLSNAPQPSKPFFCVPKVLEDGSGA